MRVTIERPDLSGPGLDMLEAEWRALEPHAKCSFFQSWTWIGCRIAERFVAPRLVRAVENGRTVGLALFNRRGVPLAPGALWLHETGRDAEDSVFIEHNAPLVADNDPRIARAILQRALARSGVVMLGGIDDPTLEHARTLGLCHVRARREAPYASLAGGDAEAWRRQLGRATRAQLGRSQRRLEALGPICWRKARDVAEALEFLDGLATLHTLSWRRRGRQGAFADPTFRRFHASLIARGLPRGEVTLSRLAVADRPIGFLYNFHWREHVLAYQSGFDTEAVSGASPGLTAHALAIADAATAGSDRYDFLAGDVRYKRNLGDAAKSLYWLELAAHHSLRGWPAWGVRQLQRQPSRGTASPGCRRGDSPPA